MLEEFNRPISVSQTQGPDEQAQLLVIQHSILIDVELVQFGLKVVFPAADQL